MRKIGQIIRKQHSIFNKYVIKIKKALKSDKKQRGNQDER